MKFDQSWNVTKRWTLPHLVTIIIIIIKIIDLKLANPKNILISTQLELSITTPICTKRSSNGNKLCILYYKGCRIRVCVGRFFTLMKNGFNSTQKIGIPSWVLGPVLEKHGSG
jgi:hypothetical protein